VSSPEAWQWQVVVGLVNAALARVEPLLKPVGRSGVGDDTEASGEYVELLARFDGTSRHGGAPYWRAIVDRAAELLTRRSKDLRLARIWSLAKSRMSGPTAILEGLVLQEALGARYLNGLHPWSDFDRAKSFQTFVEGARWDILGLGENADLNELLAMGSALDATMARFSTVFPAVHDGFRPLEEALRTARTRIVPSRASVPGAPVPRAPDHVGDFLAESRRSHDLTQPEVLHVVLRFPDAVELASRPMRRLAPYRMQLLVRARPDSIGLLKASVNVATLAAVDRPRLRFSVEVDGGLLRGQGAEAAMLYRSEPLSLSPAWETPPVDVEVVASVTDCLVLNVSVWLVSTTGETLLSKGSARLPVRPER